MTVINQDFEVYNGDSFQLDFTILDPHSGITDLTGATLRWQLALTVRSRALLSKATGSGIVITDAPNGRCSVMLTPADTRAIAPGDYYHELKETDAAGDVSTLATGTATVIAALIR